MTAPPGATPDTTESIAAPERHREVAGAALPRRHRDRIVRDFMEMHPGMPAGRALEMARAFIADPDGFTTKACRTGWRPMNLDRLARLMEELPMGIAKRPARRDEEYSTRAARQRWQRNRGLVAS